MEARLFLDGRLVTLDERQPEATALAAVAGRILAVGEEAGCRDALRAAGCERPDEVRLDGATVLPGFIDTHLHPIPLVVFEMNADLGRARSIAQVIQILSRAAERCGDDEWVLGLQLDDEALAERRLPTRHELDRACGQRSAVVIERDGHTAIGNSRALEIAGIDAQRPDPPGGVIDREEDGTPAGPCREAAAQILLGPLPAPPLERLREAGRACFRRLVAHGITSIGAVLQTDAEGPSGAAGKLELAAMQLLLDEAPFHIYSILIGHDVAGALAARETALHRSAEGGPQRRVGGFKIFSDGTLGSCTACMAQPFSDATGTAGFLVHEPEEIRRRMQAAHDAGLQVCVHAIGDLAVERCIDLFAEVLEGTAPGEHRHRIEHASLVTREARERMARLGLCVSTQPLFIRSEREWLHRRLGPERARITYPLRDLLDAGIRVAGASDAPIESTAVLDAIQCCVTRDGFEPAQCIRVEEAIALFTRDAAWLQFEESDKGTLTPGKLADLVILGGDPRQVPADRIGEIPVLETVVAGRTVYRCGPGPSGE